MTQRRVKRIALAIALAGSTVLAGMMPAAAGEKKVGTCPGPFVSIPTSTYPNQGPLLDTNGDGTLCQIPLPGVGNEGAFNVVDNLAAPHEA
jgi:hypothetical protein